MRAASTAEHSIVLLGLYSKKYPAIGESHGLSVVAGNLMAKTPANILHTHVLDMVEWGEEDCSRAVELIRATGADALAIGLPYGTFSSLARYYPALRSALRGQRPLVVFGGALATYLSDRILRDIDRAAVVILGEAEEALPRVVHNWLRQQRYDGIPNLHFTRPDGADTRTRRRLVDLRHPKPTFRGQVRRIYAKGGQVFVETSRGCSWAACTFCLRGLTDVVGRSFEYRRKPAAHVAAELNSLAELGIEQVTFADEDFLGGSLADCEEFIGEMAAQKISFPQFDASLTVHSVYSRRDENDHDARRVQLIERLAELGLRKVFLGVESCSPSQLKRYAKGHTRQEVTAALKRLYGSDIRVEIGVILFDPLCTLDEVKDSLMFMRQHGLVALASGLSSHLRLQAGSHYLTLLHRYEQRTGERLHEPILDPDTLTYPYRFKDERVDKLFQAVRRWNDDLHPLYYPAKSLSRTSETGILGAAAHSLRRALAEFRDGQCEAMLAAICALEQGEGPEAALQKHLSAAGAALAFAVRRATDGLSPRDAAHPVVRQAAEFANNTIQLNHLTA